MQQLEEDFRQLCTFWIDETLFGVDVSQVQEVVRDMAETPVPLAHPAIRALINLRGQVVTVVELRACLGLPVPEQKAIYVVLRYQGDFFGLRVDRMNGVIEVSETEFEGVPDAQGNAQGVLVRGAYKLDKGLVLEVEVERIAHAVGVKAA